MIATLVSCVTAPPSNGRGGPASGDERALIAQVNLLETEASASEDRGDLARARDLRERALEIRLRGDGPETKPTSVALNNLALVYENMGAATKAVALLQRSIAISEKLSGPDSIDVSQTLRNLGMVYLHLGQYDRATPYLNRAIQIQTTALGWDDPEVAKSALAQGELFEKMDHCSEAVIIYKDAARIFEKTGGPQSIDLATALDGQARSATCVGNYDEAVPLYERALAIREVRLGPAHWQVAQTLNNLAELLRLRKEFAQAGKVLERALAVATRAVGPVSPLIGNIESNLGLLDIESRGDLARAERNLLDAATIHQKFSPDGSAVARDLECLAEVYWAKNDSRRAASTLNRALELTDTILVKELYAHPLALVGARLESLWGQKAQESLIVSLQSQTNDPAARRSAMTTLLRRKGLMLALMGDSARVLRKRLAPAAFAEFLSVERAKARSDFENLVQGNPADPFGKRDRAFDEKLQHFVDQVGGQAVFQPPADSVTVERVAASIPAGARLVEFITYIPFDFRVPEKKPNVAHYAAFVLRPDGNVAFVDLGSVVPIEAQVARVRAALSDPSDDPRPSARALDELVMRPVRALLGTSRRVILAPDSALSVVPFAALVDEKGDYLVRRWSFSYLATGRELLHLADPPRARAGSSVVVANPEFGSSALESGGAPAAGATDPGAVVTRLARASFPALPATIKEGQAVAAALGGSLLSGAAATHDAVAALRSPLVLHLATHGFYLRASAGVAAADSRGLSLDVGDGSAPAANSLYSDALDRAGLVLAGANLHRPDDDGILTAAETMWLDLDATELVVLSACETGIGETGSGGGVYGLPAAIIVAGARSVVMSLWKVDDEATSRLMLAFYGGLTRGQPRADALRDAQLGLLATNERAHPYYWASFIAYGDGAPLPEVAKQP